MCKKLPKTNGEFLQVKGVGAHKLEKYGLPFLQAIRTFCENHPDREPSLVEENGLHLEEEKLSRTKREQSGVKETKPSHLISYDHYMEGVSFADIAKVRNMSLITIQSHIIRCAEEGLDINWDKELPLEYRPKIEEAVRTAATDKLKPIKELLPEEVSYFMIRAYFFLNQPK